MPRQASPERPAITDFRSEERLAVFGSLRPGASNAGLLAHLDGMWFAGWVAGTLEQRGWAAAEGYPGIRLASGHKVEVDLLCSHQLPEYLPELDAFEGEDYRRVTTVVTVDGECFCAQIYELA